MLASRFCGKGRDCSWKPNLKVDRGGHDGAALEQEGSGADSGEEAHDGQVIAIQYAICYRDKCDSLKEQVDL